MAIEKARSFIARHTRITSSPLVPEIDLHLADEITPIWQATEETLKQMNVSPPYWAFAWPGGQAMARFILDHPRRFAGQRVLDFAAGAGLCAIAAAKVGASQVLAADIDPLATIALAMNAERNDVTFPIESSDIVGSESAWDIVVAGDVCYERPMADRVTQWLRHLAQKGTIVLLADPGRAYLPKEGLQEIARYKVPTTLELEDRTERETILWQMC